MNKLIISLVAIIVIIVSITVLFKYSSDKNESTVQSLKNNNSTDSIQIENFAYSPLIYKIRVGSTVKWTNMDNVKHTITSDSGDELNSPPLSQGQTYEHRFSEAGTYTYHCTPHPYMKATIIVQ